ncbi:MAG: DUF2283 domain-containing protein [Chloroflexi bacterium]|nr:MAG: DUF2283 domain-containing protein [Chloroflexota bacterium]
MPELRLTYDASSDTAYLHLESVKRQIGDSRVCEEMGDPVSTIIDIDTSGRVVGIEFFNATRRLPVHLLSEATEAE